MLALLAPAAACAPLYQWEKAGADTALAQKDSAECRQLSQSASFRNFNQPMPPPWAGSETYTPYLGLRQDNPNMWSQSPYTGESPAAYSGRVNAWCMRRRGYEQVLKTPTTATAEVAKE
jgi:hypothetical protein